MVNVATWRVANPPNFWAEKFAAAAHAAYFSRFPAIGTLLDYQLARARSFSTGSEKGDKEMSVRSQLSRTLIAIAALAMGTVAVTAAVGPVAAGATQPQVSVNA
jgi:hypothetical protein